MKIDKVQRKISRMRGVIISSKTDDVQIFLRIIGLEESASSCRSILEPSFNNQVIFHFELGSGLVGRVGLGVWMGLVWIFWLV